VTSALTRSACRDGQGRDWLLVQDRPLAYEQAYGVGIADMMHRRPSIDRAFRDLDWTPSVPLERIVQEAVTGAS
jgi:nucleoside-diphosphate-sugar epimerase